MESCCWIFLQPARCNTTFGHYVEGSEDSHLDGATALDSLAHVPVGDRRIIRRRVAAAEVDDRHLATVHEERAFLHGHRPLQLLVCLVDAGNAKLGEETQRQQRLVDVVVLAGLVDHQHERVDSVAAREAREEGSLEGVVGANGFGEGGTGVFGGRVEVSGLDVVVDVVGGHVHEGRNLLCVRLVGGEQILVHFGQLLLFSRKRTGNGVQFDLEHPVSALIDHVIRAEKTQDEGLVEGRLQSLPGNADKITGEVVRDTTDEVQQRNTLLQFGKQEFRVFTDTQHQFCKELVQLDSVFVLRLRNLDVKLKQPDQPERGTGKRAYA